MDSHLLKPILICLLTLYACKTKQKVILQSVNLTIEKVSANCYVHTSYLDTEKWGKVACNGLIVIDKNQAVVLDTPVDSIAALQLISYLALNHQITSKNITVVPTHFHVDCLGSLQTFHNDGIKSIAYRSTIALAKKDAATIPIEPFDSVLTLRVGKKVVTIFHPGEGHTKDNVVAYVPEQKVLFGGCLVKSAGASKGNLKDSNEEAWTSSINYIISRLPKVKVVVPGHGQWGGAELLTYTAELFSKE